MPPVVAEMGVEIAKEAVQHQLEVMKEQAKKAKEFVDKKVSHAITVYFHLKFFFLN